MSKKTLKQAVAELVQENPQISLKALQDACQERGLSHDFGELFVRLVSAEAGVKWRGAK